MVYVGLYRGQPFFARYSSSVTALSHKRLQPLVKEIASLHWLPVRHSPCSSSPLKPDVRKPCLIVVNNVNIRGAAFPHCPRSLAPRPARVSSRAGRRRPRPRPDAGRRRLSRAHSRQGSLRPHDNFVIQAFGSCARVHPAVTIGGVRGQPACEFRMRPTGPAGSPDPGGRCQGRFRRARHSWVQPCASRVVQKRGGNRCLYRLV
jgi:hypothetical protein